MKKLGCYLRPYRRRSGLTEGELAYLLGHRSGSVVSRIEQEKRIASLRQALALEIIFGTGPEQLFPTLFDQVEADVIRRAYELHERLQGNPSRKTRAKLELLESALKRATERGNQQEA